MKQIYILLHCACLKSGSYQRLLLLFIISLLSPVYGFAQQLNLEFIKTYNYAGAGSMDIGPDNQPVLYSLDVATNTLRETTLAKFNTQGSLVWEHHPQHQINYVEVAYDNSSYFLGNSILMRVDTEGALQWQHDLSQYNLQAVHVTSDAQGFVYVTGYLNRNEIAVLKLDFTAGFQWLKKYPVPTPASSDQQIRITLGDALYVAAVAIDAQEIRYTTLLKVDHITGALLFLQAYRNDASPGAHHRLREIKWDVNGYLYLFSNSSSAQSTDASVQHVLKVNSNGAIVWDNFYRYEGRDYFVDAALDTQGNIYLLTSVQTDPHGIATAKIDNGGNLVWQDLFRGEADTRAYPAAVVPLPDGTVVTAGRLSYLSQTESLANKIDVVLLMYRADGNRTLQELINTTATSSDIVQDMQADTEGNIYMYIRTAPNRDFVNEQTYLVLRKYRSSALCYFSEHLAKGGVLDCRTNTTQLLASSAVANATYSWSGPNGFTSSDQAPIVNAPGEYTVTTTVPNGCSITLAVSVLPAGTSACYTLDFENEEPGLIATTATPLGTVLLNGKKAYAHAPYLSYAQENHAAIFDSGMPTGDDDDLHTLDWGKVLIINQDFTNTPNDNQWGGELTIDFAGYHPVTLQSLKALDIDVYEDDSWVYLYDEKGNELYRKQLQPLGNNSKQEVSLGNTKGVARLKVVLGGRGTWVGSGAIDDIKFCIETEPCNNLTTGNTLAAYAAPTLFSDKTTIAFEATEAAPYTITLHDLRGNQIRELATGQTIAGESKAIEVNGSKLPNGMYFARIVNGSKSKTIKLIVSR